MNDKFVVIRKTKEFIYLIDELLINIPRSEMIIKERFKNDILDILELIYIANIKDEDSYKIKILAKLSMCDYYLENLYKKKIISERVFKVYSTKLLDITKLIYGWIRSESKNR